MKKQGFCADSLKNQLYNFLCKDIWVLKLNFIAPHFCCPTQPVFLRYSMVLHLESLSLMIRSRGKWPTFVTFLTHKTALPKQDNMIVSQKWLCPEQVLFTCKWMNWLTHVCSDTTGTNALLECNSDQSSNVYWYLEAEEAEVNQEQKASWCADTFNVTLGYGEGNADSYRIALSKGSTAVTINRQQSYCSTRATVRRVCANYILGLTLRN